MQFRSDFLEVFIDEFFFIVFYYGNGSTKGTLKYYR